MRCFLGTELEDSLVPRISDVINSFTELDIDMKPVRDENLHLTVKFLGDISEERLKKVDAVEEVTDEIEPFEIELGGIGVFPSRDYIKVIWIGAGKGGKRFKELMRKVELKLSDKGFEKDKNDPVPHITIGRIKSGRNKESIKSKLDELNGKIFGTMPVDEISLFKSELTPEGPVYEKIKDYRL